MHIFLHHNFRASVPKFRHFEISHTRVHIFFQWNFRASIQKLRRFERSIFQTLRKTHCCTDFLFFKLETSNLFATCFFEKFPYLCKVSARLGKLKIRHFIRVPPSNFEYITKSKNIKGGTLIKCLISNLSYLAHLKKVRK